MQKDNCKGSVTEPSESRALLIKLQTQVLFSALFLVLYLLDTKKCQQIYLPISLQCPDYILVVLLWDPPLD